MDLKFIYPYCKFEDGTRVKVFGRHNLEAR